MNWINIVSGPVLGAVIGYFTNYIAVKMLFRPYRPVRLGRWTLPFTPGVIPRRKGDLARAIGGAIENNLLRRDDILDVLASEDMRSAVANGIWSQVEARLESEATLADTAGQLLGEPRMEAVKQAALEKVSARMADKLAEIDLGGTIANLAGEAVRQRVHKSMLAMFLTPDTIASFTAPMAERINAYISTDGMARLKDILDQETDGFLNRPMNTLLHLDPETKSRVCAKIGDIYAEFMANNAAQLAEGFEIGRIVEQKINDMDVAEFERLVMSVMKHELGMIVNLGALIGLVIGALNLLL